MRRIQKIRVAAALAATLATIPLAACSGSGSSDPAVPSLNASNAGPHGQGEGSSSPARAAALHTAVACIRQHGIPGYTDPVLTPSGTVYSDSRSFQDASAAVVDAVQQACGTLMGQANLNPQSEPPAPPQLVQAGVRVAGCLRSHGLPNVTDPTAQSQYTPGHGFGMTAGEIPAGGKSSPQWQQAAHACQSQIHAEIQASTLANLGNDG
jgi:hypothetical protein